MARGQRLTRTLRLDKALRVKTLPLSLSVPWGLGVGVTAVLPYVPLPTKLTTRVLDPMRPLDGEPAERFGDRVEAAMEAALTAMTADRVPLIG